MQYIPIILGILFNSGCFCVSTGVIDVSDFKTKNIFSGPTKIGDALFYKYICNDNGNYSNVFDGNYRIFPVKSHTRLVNIVLASKDDNLELIQVMYSDVKKDYRLSNLYYRKNEGSWDLINRSTYKSELYKLKNNNVSFDVTKPVNKGFKKLDSSPGDGFVTYVTDKGYELDSVFSEDNLIWESDPSYHFKSLDLKTTLDGPEEIRLNYSNYFSEVSQYYRRSGGRWQFDFGQRELDLLSLYTQGCERRKPSDTKKSESFRFKNKYFFDETAEYVEKVSFLCSDLCDLDSGSPLSTIHLNLNLDNSKAHDLTINHFYSYEVTSFGFSDLSGAWLESITDGEDSVCEFPLDSGEKFLEARFSYVDDYSVMAVDVAFLKRTGLSPTPGTSGTKKPTMEEDHRYYKRTESGWFCLEKSGYFLELNRILEAGSILSVKRNRKSPPKTPTLTPSTPNLDYGGMATFTYDLNNPFEERLRQDIMYTDPDVIRLYTKPGNVVNVVIDGYNILWEQKESGSGCKVIYIYRSDTHLMAHMLIDSKTEPHLFFYYNNNKWNPITKDEYEGMKDFSTGKGSKKKVSNPVDEYVIPPYPEDGEKTAPSKEDDNESHIDLDSEDSKHAYQSLDSLAL